MTEKTEGWDVYAQLLILSVAWGGAFLFTKVAVETIPPFLLAAGRGLIAAAVLAARWPSQAAAGRSR